MRFRDGALAGITDSDSRLPKPSSRRLRWPGFLDTVAATSRSPAASSVFSCSRSSQPSLSKATAYAERFIFARAAATKSDIDRLFFSGFGNLCVNPI